MKSATHRFAIAPAFRILRLMAAGDLVTGDDVALPVPGRRLSEGQRGNAARHNTPGAVRHVYASSVVTGLVLGSAVRILLHYSGLPGSGNVLRTSALWLLRITFVAVFLGIASYMSCIATADAPQPIPVMDLFAVLHVATGALAVAASVIAAIQGYRNVRPPEHQCAEGVAIA